MTAPIIVIGRGHSGTRAISQLLTASGINMGNRVNASGDLVPPHEMYSAAQTYGVFAHHEGVRRDVRAWDFERVADSQPGAPFRQSVDEYLRQCPRGRDAGWGWKLPETTLCYPWIAKMFPRAKFIWWVRHPYDNIISQHLTDNLLEFSAPVNAVDWRTENGDAARWMRAVSWLYQYEIVRQTPRPENFIRVRFEDFVQNQDAEVARLEQFLSRKLGRVVTRPESVGRWRGVTDQKWPAWLAGPIHELDYEDAGGNS